MFDIDKELEKIKFKKHMPAEAVRQRVLHMAYEKTHKKAQPEKRRLKLLTALPIAAVLVAAILLFVMPTVQAAGYYTIDINPSISVEVDKNDNVLHVYAENDEAEKLLAGTNLAGMPFENAFGVIVELAAKQGYLKDESRVLVAHFGDTPGISIKQAKASIEEATKAQVRILLLQSEKSDYENAKRQNKKAGIELLNKKSEALNIEEQDTVKKIDALCEHAESGKDKGKSADKANSDRGNANGNFDLKDEKDRSNEADIKDDKKPPAAEDNRNQNAQKDKPNGGRKINPPKPVK